MVAALRESGLVVDHAADGEEGSHFAEQGIYDAIVLDLMLPRKSGSAFFRICVEENFILRS